MAVFKELLPRSRGLSKMTWPRVLLSRAFGACEKLPASTFQKRPM